MRPHDVRAAAASNRFATVSGQSALGAFSYEPPSLLLVAVVPAPRALSGGWKG